MLFVLVTTHITIAAVTVFLHRAQAHRALDLGPVPAHFFRAWLWLTTGMVTKEWVAIHRKHHAKCETEEDPHSPQTRGIETVLWRGAELYREEAKNQETMAKFGHGTPNDWIERNGGRSRRELARMRLAECLSHRLVLILEQAAGRVDQPATGFEQARGARKYCRLFLA